MSLPDPTTEREVFLAKAAGASETLPATNNTRDEIYLRAIAEGGGGGGGSDLPDVTSADAGKVLKVNASGEWATGQDDGERFVITLTHDAGWTADKTFAEMKAAYEAGKRLIARYSYMSMFLISAPVEAELTSATFMEYSGYDVAYLCFTSAQIGFSDRSDTVLYTYSDIPGSESDSWTFGGVSSPPSVAGGTGDPTTDTINLVKYILADTEYYAVKTYSTTGNNTDGTMTQAAITTAINDASPFYKIDTTTAASHSAFRSGFTTLFNSVLASAVASVGTRVSSASSFSCSSVTNLLAICLGLAPKVPELFVTAAGQTLLMFLFSHYYNHYFFQAFIPYNDGTDDYNLDCMFLIDSAGMTIAMTAYAA